MKKTLIIIGVILLVVVLYLFAAYNGLVGLDEKVTGQWAQVESQYQRRFDLIPNLVESVKGIMNQEQEVFGAIADARANYAGAKTVDEKAQAAGQVESALGRLLVITENYPALQSSATVQNLMTQIEGTENRISTERKRYNDTVQIYNVRIKRFPGSIVASMFSFGERSYFESVEGSELAPQVQF
ncbi:MAG: LemA family protein [Candidatus Paceibacterota bacterium]|jgi:LemA protein